MLDQQQGQAAQIEIGESVKNKNNIKLL